MSNEKSEMDKTEVEDFCESCLCFKEISATSGKCRNSPPVLPAGARNGTGLGAWIQPVVSHNDWCAEHINKDFMNPELEVTDVDFMEEVVGGGSVADDTVGVVGEPETTDENKPGVKEQTEEEKLAEMMGGESTSEAPAPAPAAKAPPKKKGVAKK